jgi:EAL domain-containing protein (putative c-di-GMP-specific phosphodiesterase class I)
MVVQLGSMFGLQVVAQGIEREDQREALAALGCELGQGYLLGRPLPLSSPVGISAGNRGLSGESLPSL